MVGRRRRRGVVVVTVTAAGAIAMRMIAVILMAMRAVLEVVTLGHDEDPAAHADDLDRRAVETREDRAGDDLVDGAERRPSAAEIEHAIDRAQERVELV